MGHVCLGLGVLALGTMLSWVFFFPQWGLGVCVVLWSAGCKSIQFLVQSIQFLVHSFNPLRNPPHLGASRRVTCRMPTPPAHLVSAGSGATAVPRAAAACSRRPNHRAKCAGWRTGPVWSRSGEMVGSPPLNWPGTSSPLLPASSACPHLRVPQHQFALSMAVLIICVARRSVVLAACCPVWNGLRCKTGGSEEF